jgi:hypothetical protein
MLLADQTTEDVSPRLTLLSLSIAVLGQLQTCVVSRASLIAVKALYAAAVAAAAS